MLISNKLDCALALAIPSASTRDCNHNDLVKIMTSYGVIEKAKDAFLAQEIDFEEYIQLCEMHEVNVDDYMDTIEHNLVELKLI
jgi:hypothetical protein